MYSDIVVASDQRTNFMNWRSERELKLGTKICPFDQFNATILTGSHWPYSPSLKLQIPEEIKQCMTIFLEYFNENFPHKTLAWSYLSGTMTLNYNHGGKITELVCTTMQGILMMIFNWQEKITCQDLIEKLGLPEDQAKRHLHSLCVGPQGILIKEPGNGEFLITDIFFLNNEFNSQLRRVHLPLPLQQEETQTGKVNTDRGFAIEAGIVKIMKARKVLNHNDLLNDLVKVLPTFAPDPKVNWPIIP